MSFNRIIETTDKFGNRVKMYPFHISSPGLDRLIFKSEGDLSIASNFIIIQALRFGVRVIAFIVMNNHLHVLILAPDYVSAQRYADGLKQVLSHSLSVKNQEHEHTFLNIDFKPLLIHDDYHLRNTICYIPRNSLDTGIKVEDYKWSSYRAYFRGGSIPETSVKVNDLPKRHIRRILRTDMDLSSTGWYIDGQGMLEPVTTCDWRYAEAAFFNDLSFFMRVMGGVKDAGMEQVNVINRYKKLNDKDFYKIISKRSQEMFNASPADLVMEQKIRLIKILYYSYCTTVPQLARCLATPKEQVASILRISKY